MALTKKEIAQIKAGKYRPTAEIPRSVIERLSKGRRCFVAFEDGRFYFGTNNGTSQEGQDG